MFLRACTAFSLMCEWRDDKTAINDDIVPSSTTVYSGFPKFILASTPKQIKIQ